MPQYLEAFILGNAAILSNVCVLPLYPGMIAFLAGRGGNGGVRKNALLGLLVLTGVLSLMLAIGAILFLSRRSISMILPVFLPVAYAAVLVLGVSLLFGRNPFVRLAGAQAPMLRNPYATAYLYGLLLGPMTLPCTGPLIISAFVLGAGNSLLLADGLLYFLAFGLGFGWPMVALAMAAATTGRRLTRWLAHHEALTQRISGVLLIGIALFGFWIDVVPNLPLLIPGVSESAVVPVPNPVEASTAPAGPAAPELVGITNWLNSEPLDMNALRGKVVLVHFWTLGCINCIHTLPYVVQWHETYHDQGLVVLGIHSPEFQYEYETAAVSDAIRRHKIAYPVAQDNNFATWKAYRNRYWPTMYLIDTHGTLRYTHIGEGAYEITEQQIRDLLAER
jgi:cytochrome c biogenesis protein CcdA/thiol-disulfide isomerase/thioredoxin